MATVTFDTLEFVRSLETAGLPSNQAEAIAAAVRKAQESIDVATKADVRILEAKLDFIKWMLGFMFAALISLVIKAFF